MISIFRTIIVVLAFSALLWGCGNRGGMGGMLTPADVLIIKHHARQHYICLEEFCRRLYLKNPKYEPDISNRAKKLYTIFKTPRKIGSPFDDEPSNKILTAAFAAETTYKDRVALLALGLKKSIDEGYRQDVSHKTMVTSLQIPLERLRRLYSNLSQVKWRLKVYHDQQEKLYFITNEKAPEGHLNMGYEVLMTKVLTRLEDDIYLRGGNPPHEIFRMSTMFFSLFL